MGFTSLSKRLASISPWIGNKAVLASAAILILIFFGDALLPWLGHLAFLLLESVEEALDVLLEHAFALAPRSAQMVVVWSASALLLFWLVRTIQKIHHYVQDELMVKVLRQYAELQATPWTAWLNHPWVKAAVLMVALGIFLLLFS